MPFAPRSSPPTVRQAVTDLVHAVAPFTRPSAPAVSTSALREAVAALEAWKAQRDAASRRLADVSAANEPLRRTIDAEPVALARLEALRESQAARALDAKIAGQSIDAAALDAEMVQCERDHVAARRAADVARREAAIIEQRSAAIRAELADLNARGPHLLAAIIDQRIADQAPIFDAARAELVAAWSTAMALATARAKLMRIVGGEDHRPRELRDGLQISYPRHAAYGPVTEWPDYGAEADAILDDLLR